MTREVPIAPELREGAREGTNQRVSAFRQMQAMFSMQEGITGNTFTDYAVPAGFGGAFNT